LKVVASVFGNAESGNKSPHSKIARARTWFGVRRFIAAIRAPARNVTTAAFAARGVQFTKVDLRADRGPLGEWTLPALPRQTDVAAL